MKIIVAHKSPDLDAICSVWLLKRFLQGWEDAEVRFVPAGDRIKNTTYKEPDTNNPIELFGESELIHVDTGLGPLDHHQIQNNNVCAASLTYEYVKSQSHNSLTSNEIRREGIKRIVEFTINEDHFQEVHYEQAQSELYDFSLARLIDGYKVFHPGDDMMCTTFGMECLDITLHVLERRIWAEQEIKEKGKEFKTKYGKALAVESVNDTVLEVAQKSGYAIAVRRDPNHGYIRIKAKPLKRNTNDEKHNVDLTDAYEALKKVDPDATWYLHVSKKMLLNGSSKNPTMSSSKLSLDEVIAVLEKI